MEKGWVVEGVFHEVGALSIDDVATLLMNLSLESFTASGTEVGPPALRMNLGLSNNSINPIYAPTLRLTFPRYIVVNRNGSVNELEAASRSFNPLTIFHEMKSVCVRQRYFAPTHAR